MPNVGIEEDMPLDFMAFEAISGACKTKHFGPKSSAYDLNLLSIAQCKKSKYWSNPEQGNSWYESILTEVQTLLRFKVYTVVEKTAADGHNIFRMLVRKIPHLRLKSLTNEKQESCSEATDVLQGATSVDWTHMPRYPHGDRSSCN